MPQKARICFRVHYRHKGDAAVKFEALSSACQIVNERLLECVQPAQKKQSRAHAFQATLFKSSLESHHAALQCIIKIKTHSPMFVEQLKLY